MDNRENNQQHDMQRVGDMDRGDMSRKDHTGGSRYNQEKNQSQDRHSGQHTN